MQTVLHGIQRADLVPKLRHQEAILEATWRDLAGPGKLWDHDSLYR